MRRLARIMVTAAGLAALPPPAARTAETGQPARQLIADPLFQQGFELLKPEPGKLVVAAVLRWPGAVGDAPVWRLAQWSSKHALEGAEPNDVSPAGLVRLANSAKTVAVAPATHDDGVILLGVNGSVEYGDRARKQGENWPHLLVAQRFRKPPVIADVRKAIFTISVRLRSSQLQRTPDYTPSLHAAQFQVFFNVQNLNRASSGYGDFLYFGIPLYDSRFRIPRAFRNPDQVGKFIYTPSGDVYTSASVHDGEWVAVEKDILPLMLKGLDAAWDRGFLQGSRDRRDYRIAAMNMGWEVPGILDVLMQVRDLGLKVDVKR